MPCYSLSGWNSSPKACSSPLGSSEVSITPPPHLFFQKCLFLCLPEDTETSERVRKWKDRKQQILGRQAKKWPEETPANSWLKWTLVSFYVELKMNHWRHVVIWVVTTCPYLFFCSDCIFGFEKKSFPEGRGQPEKGDSPEKQVGEEPPLAIKRKARGQWDLRTVYERESKAVEGVGGMNTAWRGERTTASREGVREKVWSCRTGKRVFLASLFPGAPGEGIQSAA